MLENTSVKHRFRMLMNYDTASTISLAIAKYFGTRTHIIVANVSWGMDLPYEADLLILHASGYMDEVEIKISKSDLRRDRLKYHNHDGRHIRRLWFAVPEKLAPIIHEIQERAGVLVVGADGRVRMERRPIINKLAPKLRDDQKFQLARLGAMRVWDLKWVLLHK
jgi:hypothetical protein